MLGCFPPGSRASSPLQGWNHLLLIVLLLFLGEKKTHIIVLTPLKHCHVFELSALVRWHPPRDPGRCELFHPGAGA
ncbi:hypothetical protein BJX66DRAFT_293764 [Aspergillus keveii]|uniref:Uncharacterized protein n=1 Tax=Aspergillus keveii TaxID=714993 RepID=A0ABR4GK34_9EURO